MVIKVERKILTKHELAKLLKKVKSFLVSRNIPVKQMYLFGSYSRGSAHMDSDIDVAIVVPNKKSASVGAIEKIEAEIKRIHVKLEPHFLTQKDLQNKYSTFVAEVKKGMVV